MIETTDIKSNPIGEHPIKDKTSSKVMVKTPDVVWRQLKLESYKVNTVDRRVDFIKGKWFKVRSRNIYIYISCFILFALINICFNKVA
jgi:streptogramin lyase